MKVLHIQKVEDGFDVFTENGVIPFGNHTLPDLSDRPESHFASMNYELYLLGQYGVQSRENTPEGEIAATRQT